MPLVRRRPDGPPRLADTDRIVSAVDLLGAIGRTPIIRITRLASRNGAEILLKWEGANPTGSMKDRMALAIVEGAERRGELRPGGRVVEYTGGSTGSSLAMVCAAKGYRATFVSSDAFAAEKLRTMRALGAEVEVVPSVDRQITPELVQAIVGRARELAAEPETFWADQYNNLDNRSAYHDMATEILDQTDGRVDVFIQGVGTGGSFSGNAEVLKDAIPGIRCVAVEPAASRHLSGGRLGGHRIEGIGNGLVTSITRTDLIDQIVAVTDDDAESMARRLAAVEGLLVGTSTGANLVAALQVADELGPGRRVVTIAVDSGLKYLGGELYG
jgi:cysteine synthase